MAKLTHCSAKWKYSFRLSSTWLIEMTTTNEIHAEITIPKLTTACLSVADRTIVTATQVLDEGYSRTKGIFERYPCIDDFFAGFDSIIAAQQSELDSLKSQDCIVGSLHALQASSVELMRSLVKGCRGSA